MSLSSVFEALVQTVRCSLPGFIADPSSFCLVPITSQSALEICSAAKLSFSSDSTLLDLTGEILVLGDLHGHILDFLRILREFGFPPSRRYLLLGDLVDRGEFSIHTALYVFVLKVLFPDSFFVIRGNHEWEDVNSTHGLLAEVFDAYSGREVFDALNEVFAMIPIAARLNGGFLCVHGGIGPGLVSVRQIEEIQRPLTDCENTIVASLMWSDPMEGVEMRPSERCRGFEFGERPLAEFLAANGLKMLVRGHTAIADGVLYGLERKVVTVFSVSNYCNLRQGCCGVLEIGEGREPKTHLLPALPYVERQVGAMPVVLPRVRKLSVTPHFPRAVSHPPIIVHLKSPRALNAVRASCGEMKRRGG
jgi:protein phosphatase